MIRHGVTGTCRPQAAFHPPGVRVLSPASRISAPTATDGGLTTPADLQGLPASVTMTAVRSGCGPSVTCRDRPSGHSGACFHFGAMPTNRDIDVQKPAVVVECHQ